MSQVRIDGADIVPVHQCSPCGGRRQLEHAHRCPQCGHVVKGDEIPYQSIISGVITCPKCEWSGPINIQIVPEEPDTV